MPREPKNWPDRYARALDFRRLSKRVQVRLRGQKIFIHNILVREIIRTALDLITERMRTEQTLFFKRWAAGDWEIEADRRNALCKAIHKRYDQRWFESPRIRILFSERIIRRKAPKPKHKWDLMKVSHLTDAETLALADLRAEMVGLNDSDAVAAIDKALQYLRPPTRPKK